MGMDFEDKVVLITGAGSGIGRETAKLYVHNGAKVVVSDINEEGGHDTVSQIKELGGEAIFVRTDVADFDSVKSLIETTVNHYGRIDVAVNNAGVGGVPGKTADADLKAWDKVIAVNQTGVFYCMKLEIPQMLSQGGGSIINIASIAGLKGLPSSLAYVASKHAVVGMTKTAAMEYARHNIRVNAVCPVFTVSPMFQPDVMDKISAGLSDKLKKGIPMKRFAHVSEMAETILWLSSEKASFVTGHAMPVDGGLTA